MALRNQSPRTPNASDQTREIREYEKRLVDLKLEIKLKKQFLEELSNDPKFTNLRRDIQVRRLEDEIIVRNKQIHNLSQEIVQYNIRIKALEQLVPQQQKRKTDYTTHSKTRVTHYLIQIGL